MILTGTVVFERRLDDDGKLETEILESVVGCSDPLYFDCDEEFRYAFDKFDLPTTAGMFVIQAAIEVIYSKDYYGEVDVDYILLWFHTTTLSSKKADEYLKSLNL
jgi:hypothetical protein